jgi:hypothetical protein
MLRHYATGGSTYSWNRIHFIATIFTLPPIRWIPGALSPGQKLVRREAGKATDSWNANEDIIMKISGNNTRTTINRFPTKNCHTRNITHHKESATS